MNCLMSLMSTGYAPSTDDLVNCQNLVVDTSHLDLTFPYDVVGPESCDDSQVPYLPGQVAWKEAEYSDQSWGGYLQTVTSCEATESVYTTSAEPVYTKAKPVYTTAAEPVHTTTAEPVYTKEKFTLKARSEDWVYLLWSDCQPSTDWKGKMSVKSCAETCAGSDYFVHATDGDQNCKCASCTEGITADNRWGLAVYTLHHR